MEVRRWEGNKLKENDGVVVQVEEGNVAQMGNGVYMKRAKEWK